MKNANTDNMDIIERIIREVISEYLEEGRFTSTATPYDSHADRRRSLGSNPLTVDNGGHSAHDVVSQVSTVDRNGANFKSDGNDIILSDNRYTFYKIKNFGTDRIDNTLSLFGSGASGEKEVRRAIDQLNGAADRNGKRLMYRTITSETFEKISKHTNHMAKTFWEFSLDGGNSWYILKPEPIQSMKPSSLKTVSK